LDGRSKSRKKQAAILFMQKISYVIENTQLWRDFCSEQGAKNYTAKLAV